MKIKKKKKTAVILTFRRNMLHVIKRDSLPQIGSKVDLKLFSNFTKMLIRRFLNFRFKSLKRIHNSLYAFKLMHPKRHES